MIWLFVVFDVLIITCCFGIQHYFKLNCIVQLCVWKITTVLCHDDVIIWKHFSRYWPFVRRPVTRSFDVFFDLRPNKRLSKQWWGWWFETQSCPLWCHCNVTLDTGNAISTFWVYFIRNCAITTVNNQIKLALYQKMLHVGTNLRNVYYSYGRNTYHQYFFFGKYVFLN